MRPLWRPFGPSPFGALAEVVTNPIQPNYTQAAPRRRPSPGAATEEVLWRRGALGRPGWLSRDAGAGVAAGVPDADAAGSSPPAPPHATACGAAPASARRAAAALGRAPGSTDRSDSRRAARGSGTAGATLGAKSSTVAGFGRAWGKEES